MWISLPILLALTVIDVTEGACQSRSEGYLYGYSGKCYQFILTEKTWLDARSYCHARNGKLASAKDTRTHNWLVSILTNRLAGIYTKQGFWLGLHDRNNENSWQWDEGRNKADSGLSWSKWYPGEPNDISGQDCVYMRRSYNWRWVDVGCGDTWHIGRTYSYACEYEMPTTTSTTTTTTTTTTPRTTTQPPTTQPPTTQPPTTTPTTTLPTTTPMAKPASTTTTVAPTTVTLSTAAPTTSPPVTSGSVLLKTTPQNVSVSATVSLSSIKRATSKFPATASQTQLPKATTSDPPPPLPPSVGAENNQAGNTFLSGAHVGSSSQDEQSNGHTTSLAAGVISALLLIIAILIIALLVKRRRDKKNLPPAHSLANPCYVDTAGTNNLDREDNPYATCQDMGIISRGNVYVEVGDNPNVKFTATDEQVAFSNQRYMASPRRGDNEVVECMDNVSNERRDATAKSKYLDECEPYTEGGYLQQRHIYADISDMAIPATSIVPSHYDIPEPLGNSPLAKDENAYLYDKVQTAQPVRSPSYSNIPTGGHYDIPKRSKDVAVEYANGSEATGSQPTGEQTSSAMHYDVPKYKLKDYVDTDVEYSV